MELHPLLQDSLEISSMKLGIERVETLDALLGYPSKQFGSVHVAGTNGKGSTTTKIAKALHENGKKVGLYTSPHISTYHERVQVNGKAISEENADRILKKIVDASPFALSYFELLTLLAFCYFSEERIDFAVFETGMGGRRDATNIIQPVLSVITSIEMDHMPYLGHSLEEIAKEKAGIIKPGVPVLIGPHVKPLSVFEEIAENLRSPLFQVQGSFAHYEEENREIARKALALLPFPLERKSIEQGLNAVPPCRFEIILEKDPLVILDVAHNPDGLKRTFERLFYQFPEAKVRVLAGFSADKDIEAVLQVIQENAVEIHLTYTDHPRLLKKGDPNFTNAFQTAFHHAKQNQEILLVCGSFFIMHAAKLVSKSMWEQQAD
jgi:dihydrofolate synthase / folylpolyglutamate synthase